MNDSINDSLNDNEVDHSFQTDPVNVDNNDVARRGGRRRRPATELPTTVSDLRRSKTRRVTPAGSSAVQNPIASRRQAGTADPMSGQRRTPTIDAGGRRGATTPGVMSVSVAAPDLIRRTRTLCEQQSRSDLVARLGHTTRRLADPSVRVLVVGEFKQGKSQLINALVNAPVCPVDDDLATSVPMEVRYGATPSAALLVASTAMSADGGFAEPEERAVPIDSLATAIVGRPADRWDARAVVGAKALLPRQILKDGLVFVDTPGVGGLASSHAASTLAALPTADAVILVSDASSEFTAPEITFLRQALAACPTVVCVLSKTDLFPDWRRVRDLDARPPRAARPPDADLPPLLEPAAGRRRARRCQPQRGVGLHRAHPVPARRRAGSARPAAAALHGPRRLGSRRQPAARPHQRARRAPGPGRHPRDGRRPQQGPHRGRGAEAPFVAVAVDALRRRRRPQRRPRPRPARPRARHRP